MNDFAFEDDDFVWLPPDNESMPSMQELERIDFERELFELANINPEHLPLELRERKMQLMHYLNGNSWDSYQEDSVNVKFRDLLDEKNGFMSEAIDYEATY